MGKFVGKYCITTLDKKLLKGENMESVKYYYLRDYWSHPRVTVCVIRDDCGKYSRGLSFCSFLDNPCKKEGRSKAYGRALKAKINEKSFEPLDENLKAAEVLQSVLAFESNPENVLTSFNAKSEFDIKLTPMEDRLFNPRENQNYN